MAVLSKSIVGFFHVATLPGWQEVFDELMTAIISFGLYDATERLYVGLVGDEAKRFQSPKPKVEVVYRGAEVAECEFPTLDRLYERCQHHDGIVYYVHTKGVFRRQQFPTVDDWRRLMTYFVIGDHVQCRRRLAAGADVVGVNWQEEPWPHFSGNFYWATSAYIRRLPSPSTLAVGPDSRRGAERWLGLDPAVRVACLHHSHVDHYHEPYPPERYAERVVPHGISCGDHQ